MMMKQLSYNLDLVDSSNSSSWSVLTVEVSGVKEIWVQGTHAS